MVVVLRNLDMSHDHHHHHHHHRATGNIKIAVFLNALFTVFQIAGAFITGSTALLAESIHDFGDTLFLILSWRFEHISRKKGDHKYTFGYRRFSILAAFINAMVIMSTSLFAIYEAISHIASPSPVNAQLLTYFAVVGIVINGLGALKTARATSWNETLVSDHLWEDFSGWVILLVVSRLIVRTGWVLLDPIVSIAIACFWLLRSYRRAKDIATILLEGAPDNVSLPDFIRDVEGITGIDSVHDVHVWSTDEHSYNCTIHVVSISNTHWITGKVQQVARRHSIAHTTVQVDTPLKSCAYASNHH